MILRGCETVTSLVFAAAPVAFGRLLLEVCKGPCCTDMQIILDPLLHSFQKMQWLTLFCTIPGALQLKNSVKKNLHCTSDAQNFIRQLILWTSPRQSWFPFCRLRQSNVCMVGGALLEPKLRGADDPECLNLCRAALSLSNHQTGRFQLRM